MSFLTRLAQVVGIVALVGIALVWAEELGQRHIAPRLASRAAARTSPLVDELDAPVPCLTPAGCPSATSCDPRCPLAPSPTGRAR